MIRTVVCTKDKCSGNKFYIETIDNRLKATCKECGSVYYFDINKEDFIMLPSCSQCNNNIFKLFYGSKGEGLYAKCTQCGAPPEKVYMDADGVQVSYEGKLLHDIRELMCQVEQRICNLEIKVEQVERAQEMLEESIAYINKYIVEQR